MVSENKNWLEKIKISSLEELKEKIWFSGTLSIPEIKQTIEFTIEELDNLKKFIESWIETQEIERQIKEKIKEKLNITKEAVKASTKSTAKLKRDQLKEGLDSEKSSKEIADMEHLWQIKEILSIKPTESIESQKKAFNLFKFSLFAIINNALVNWKKITNLEELSNINSSTLNLNKTDKIVLQKLKEICNHKDKPIYIYLNEKLNNVVSSAKKSVPSIQEIKEKIKEWKSSEISDKNPIMKFAEEHPYLAVWWAVLWAYGLYKIFSWIFGWEDNSKWSEKKEEWFLSKIFDKIPGWSAWKWILGWVLWIFWLWKALESEWVKTFFKDTLNINIDENRLTKALELFAKFQIWDAIKVLIFWVDSMKTSKLTDEYTKQVWAEIQKSKWLTKEIDPALIKTISQCKANEYINTSFSIWWVWDSFKGYVKEKIGIEKEDPVKKEHEKAVKEYLAEKTKWMKFWRDELVEDVLIKIIPDSTWTLINNWKVEKSWDWKKETSWVEVWAVATWAAVATTEWWKDKETKPDGSLHWSLDAPILFYWIKGKRFEIWKHFTSWSVRQRIEWIEREWLWIGKNKDLIKEYTQLEALISKTELSSKESVLRDKLFNKFMTENPKVLESVTNRTNFNEVIKNPKQIAELNWVTEKLRTEAESYNKLVEKLTRDKRIIAENAEREIRKARKNGKEWFIDSIKGVFVKNDYSAEWIIRNNALNDMKIIDEEILKKNQGQALKVESHLKNIESLYNKHSFDNTTRYKLSQAIFGNLSHLWVIIDTWLSKVPVAWKVYSTSKLWLKVGFLWFWAYTVAQSWWTDNFKHDAAELWFWLLPITSEILDFKAAFTGQDLAWRNLKRVDRWIRFWFWVVGTLADAASLVTLWQSQWARVWMNSIKWTKTATKVADIAKDWTMLWKIKEGLFILGQSAKWEKILTAAKIGSGAGKVLTFSSLWIATYQVTQDLLTPEYKKEATNIASKAKENIELALKK